MMRMYICDQFNKDECPAHCKHRGIHKQRGSCGPDITCCEKKEWMWVKCLLVVDYDLPNIDIPALQAHFEAGGTWTAEEFN